MVATGGGWDEGEFGVLRWPGASCGAIGECLGLRGEDLVLDGCGGAL